MATTRTAVAISVAKTISGNSPYTLAIPIAPAQGFRRGSLVAFSSGKVALAGTNPRAIIGIAAEDAVNIAAPGQTDVVHIWVACEDTIFVGSMFNATAVSATLVTDPGTTFGITQQSPATTGIWTIDRAKVTDFTNTVLIIQDIDRRNDLADPGGLLQFRFLHSVSVLTRIV